MVESIDSYRPIVVVPARFAGISHLEAMCRIARSESDPTAPQSDLDVPAAQVISDSPFKVFECVTDDRIFTSADMRPTVVLQTLDEMYRVRTSIVPSPVLARLNRALENDEPVDREIREIANVTYPYVVLPDRFVSGHH